MQHYLHATTVCHTHCCEVLFQHIEQADECRVEGNEAGYIQLMQGCGHRHLRAVGRQLCTPAGMSSRASGSSSATTIHSMHPAANPMLTGSSILKLSTKMKLGTANSGCGSAHSKVHSRALRGVVPLATSTVATARPSGMLWIPMASVTRSPCAHPRRPQNDTPISNKLFDLDNQSTPHEHQLSM